MHGLFECILGGRVDMCPCTDIDGKNKNDAGTDYGSARSEERRVGKECRL